MSKRSSLSPERSGGDKRRKTLSNDSKCNVFVGNLKYETKWQALKDHMRRAGNVDSATILESRGRSKGCGIVTYQNPRDALRAIRELNESLLEGRKIFVQPDSAPASEKDPPQSSYISSSSSVYVGNLSFDCSDRDLFDHFKSCGRIRNAQVIVHEASNKSKGFGKIEFQKARDAEAAIAQFHKTPFQTRTLIVKSWNTDDDDNDTSYGLYVGNLSYDCQTRDLFKLFGKFGKILEAIIPDHNGRSKGFALVDFKSRSSAERAIDAIDGTDFQGRPISVRWDKKATPPPQQDPPGKKNTASSLKHIDGLPHTTIYVGNLSFECRWQDLKDLFRKYGQVEHAEIVENPVTKRSKGYGLVQFLTSSEAQRAIDKVDGAEFQNRKIQVKWDKKDSAPPENVKRGNKRRSLSPKRSTSPKPPASNVKKEKKPPAEKPAPSIDGALSCPR